MIAERFGNAEPTRGLRYMKVVGDGDSSVMATIHNTVPVWGPYVRKVECANPAVRAYHSRLAKLAQDYPHYKQKLTNKTIKRLVVGARSAIKMHSITKNIRQLQADLRNAPYHVYNHNERCNPR